MLWYLLLIPLISAAALPTAALILARAPALCSKDILLLKRFSPIPQLWLPCANEKDNWQLLPVSGHHIYQKGSSYLTTFGGCWKPQPTYVVCFSFLGSVTSTSLYYFPGGSIAVPIAATTFPGSGSHNSASRTQLWNCVCLLQLWSSFSCIPSSPAPCEGLWGCQPPQKWTRTGWCLAKDA